MNSHDMHGRRTDTPANIRSLLMNEVLANVELPYQVRYLPPRARTRENCVRLSAKRQISIAACSVTEAPVAFRIRQVNGTESGGAPYEIRTFEKKMWWPVLDANYGLVNADEFLNGLAIGAYDAIKILDPHASGTAEAIARSRIISANASAIESWKMVSKRASSSFSGALPSS